MADPCGASDDRNVVGGTALLTLGALNNRHRTFWTEQSKLMEERIANEDLLRFAMEDLRSEVRRQIPVYYQKNLHEALEMVAKTKDHFESQPPKRFHSDLSRKGGKAPKADVLQQLAVEIVRQNPAIRERQLLHALKKKGDKIGLRVDGDADVIAGEPKKIYFVDPRGRQKTALVSGLKDRLYRAKQKIKSR